MAMTSGRTPEINVTPLIDVLLVLLIIFMVVAPSRPSQLETKVPSRPQDDLVVPPANEVLVVTLTAARHIELNGTQVAPGELSGVLAAALADRVDRSVIVRAPIGVAYQEVVGVVDAVRGAGAGAIGLQVDFLEA
jgi:biopolymer transport protein ExbD